MLDNLIAYSGAIASVWLIVGIYVAALFYDNYSHSQQFCSELGAIDSPTQKLSPAINNYPLGFLFVIFGSHLVILEPVTLTTITIGAMIIVHGLGTWVCGFFPMDADPYTETPSRCCEIHLWSGMVMLLSLIIAPAVIVFSNAFPLNLRLFSLICIIGCVFFSYKLALAFKAKKNSGLHQRLSYGFQIIWLFGYSLFVAW